MATDTVPPTGASSGSSVGTAHDPGHDDDSTTTATGATSSPWSTYPPCARCSTAATPTCASSCGPTWPTTPQVLVDQEQMTTADYRERVKDVVVEMAATGQTGMGFPTEYGGGGDIGASLAAFETLALGDLSVLVKVGVQFGLFGGAILQLGHPAAPRALPGRHRDRPADGLLRDDRDRPRLQRAGAGHGGDVRPGHPGVRHRDDPRGRLEGLHRQRRGPRGAGGGLRPARGGGGVARRARVRRTDPGRR